MKYPLAERFKAPQGEGLYAGTPMAFLRTVGCSVGHAVCTACDTQFDKTYLELGGGLYTIEELDLWVGAYTHVALTGGEPLDRDLRPLIRGLGKRLCHIETSGTARPKWLGASYGPAKHTLLWGRDDDGEHWSDKPVDLWICVSPKPGYREDMISMADEVKVILGGLGDGPGWPTLEDAVRWADNGKLVFVQQRNTVKDIDRRALEEALAVVDRYPQLRLSVQLHKFLVTR